MFLEGSGRPCRGQGGDADERDAGADGHPTPVRVRQEPAEQHPGTEEREPRQQRMGAVHEQPEEVVTQRTDVGIAEPRRAGAVQVPLVLPGTDAGSGQCGGDADQGDPSAAPGDHGGGQDEHGAVVDDDRPRPDLLEEQADDVEQQPPSHEPQPQRRDLCDGPLLDGAPGHQRDADTGDEHEGRREPRGQRTVPWIEQLGCPPGACRRRRRRSDRMTR